MPAERIVIGPISGIWLAPYDGVGVLERINIERTGGGTMSFDLPEVYLDCQDNSVQAGRQIIQINLRFATPDAKAIKLAMGNATSASQQDTPSEFAQHSLVLLHPDVTAQESIYLPKCYIKKSLNLNWNKDALTTVPITIIATHRNRYQQRFYKRTKAEIATLLGARSPW